MKYSWDPRKAEANAAKHGVSFAAAEGFDWKAALIRRDKRRGYGEDRFLAYAPIGDRLYCLVYTSRGDTTRIISLREANKRGGQI